MSMSQLFYEIEFLNDSINVNGKHFSKSVRVVETLGQKKIREHYLGLLELEEIYRLIDKGQSIDFDRVYVKDFSLKEYRRSRVIGEEDYVRIALEQLGQLNMWRIAMKPGKPVAFGQIGDCLFMGLPGNPVSVFVTFLIFAHPLIRKLQGTSSYLSNWLTARAGFDWKGGKRQEYLRVKYVNDNGEPTLELFPHQGSGVLSSASWASGLTISYINQDIQKGDMVPYLPFVF